jgi:hypothetical protein
MTKTTKLVLWLLTIVCTVFACFIPAIWKGIRINGYTNKLATLQTERNHCEVVQSTNHLEADKVRELLNKELGLISEAQAPQRTWTVAPILTGSIIE